MKKYILFLTISSVLILLLSCKLPFSTDPPYESEPWGCLINSDGTGFEWVMRGDTQATFTQDSQKIVYRKSDGIFTRDFAGNVEQISSLTYDDYNLISPDLQYVLQEDENDIYRMDIDGSNRINLTETPESRDYDSHISSDGNWITFVSEADTVYSIWIMDIDGENKEKVITDSTNIFFRPKLNLIDGKIYYITNLLIFGESNLNSVNLNGTELSIISTISSRGFKISGSCSIVAFGTYDYENLYDLLIYDIITEQTKTIYHNCNSFSIDWDGFKVVNGGGLITVIDLIEEDYYDISKGDYPSISPDGEKIFFIKDRELPIGD